MLKVVSVMHTVVTVTVAMTKTVKVVLQIAATAHGKAAMRLTM